MTDRERLEIIQLLQEVRKNEIQPTLRIEMAYPSDYIALCEKVAQLADVQVRYSQLERKYGLAVIESIEMRDQLKFIKQWLDDRKIVIPNFRWKLR